MEMKVEARHQLNFINPSSHVYSESCHLSGLRLKCASSLNFSENEFRTLSKACLKRPKISTSLRKAPLESGSGSNLNDRKRKGSVVLVWYRDSLNNSQAIKDAKAEFPRSKVFLIVFGKDYKKFAVKSGLSESLLEDTIFFAGSGCLFLDVPYAAQIFSARHVFAAQFYDKLDFELHQVRSSCLRYRISLHTSVPSYSARNFLLGTAFLVGSSSRMLAHADTSATIWEKHLRRGSIVPYTYSDDIIREGRYTDERTTFQKFVDWLTHMYLPDGYPNSVTKDYLSYSIWRAIQNLAASVMGVFATEALLFGLGLGRKSTPAATAAISWVLKDGLGYVGKVFYGSIAGNQFDVDPKSWRLVADAVEDAGGVLEIITPLFPGHFLLLASVANAMKGVAAMTGTATRHAIYKSLALRENQGDIATKGESQGVTCKMVGLGLGIFVSSKIGQKYFALLSAYSLGCLIHLFANWKSLSCVQFATLNRQRCSLVLQEFLQTGNVPSPYEVSRLEKVVIPPWKGYNEWIVMGATLKEAFRSGSELREALDLYRGCRYLLTRKDKNVLIVLHESCRPQDIFQAFMQAHQLRSGSSISASLNFAKRHTKEFLRSCSLKGWNTQYPLMGSRPIRVLW